MLRESSPTSPHGVLAARSPAAPTLCANARTLLMIASPRASASIPRSSSTHPDSLPGVSGSFLASSGHTVTTAPGGWLISCSSNSMPRAGDNGKIPLSATRRMVD
eukprot:2839848-Rhodomonas_salina.1